MLDWSPWTWQIGFANTAIEGRETICQLVEASKGRIEIMAGAGVNENNVEELGCSLSSILSALHFSYCSAI